MKYVVFVASLLLTGCATTCPKVKATRCNGQIVETCGTNKKWQRAMDCSKVKPIKPGASANWTCGKKADQTHGCIPGGAK